MSPSTHRPWQSRLKRWPQPGGHTPTFRSTLRAPGLCGAWGNRARAASRQGCSAARNRSGRRGTCTGTYSWGKRSGRSGRQNRPKHTHHPRELEGGRGVKLLCGSTNVWSHHSGRDAHRHRCQSSCGRLWSIHTAALYACRRDSCPNRPALPDGRTPGSRRSHPGAGAPRGGTSGAQLSTDIYEDRSGTRLRSTPDSKTQKQIKYWS